VWQILHFRFFCICSFQHHFVITFMPLYVHYIFCNQIVIYIAFVLALWIIIYGRSRSAYWNDVVERVVVHFEFWLKNWTQPCTYVALCVLDLTVLLIKLWIGNALKQQFSIFGFQIAVYLLFIK
jgi:hypothetical protein